MYKQRSFSPILIVLIFSIIAAVASGIAVYYYTVGKAELAKKEKDEELESLKKENETLKVENEQLKANEREVEQVESWKTYTSIKYNFSIKYPESWFYKDDYSSKKDFIAFASEDSELPKPETDESAKIGIRISSPLKDKERTNSPDKLEKEKITIGEGIEATKVTLLPGRKDDLMGDLKIVTIEVPIAGNKIISIENTDDYEVAIFEKMLKTFKLAR